MYIKRIIAIIVCLSLAFAGGCLFEVDEELDNNQIIIQYKSSEITKKSVTRWMQNRLSEQGISISDMKDNESWPAIRDVMIREMAVFEIAIDKAAQLGIDKLDKSAIEEMDSQIDYVAKFAVENSVKQAVAANPALDYDQEFQKQFDQYLLSIGYTYDSYRDEIMRSYIFKNIQDYYFSQITVTDQDVRSNYESNLSIQKGNIENDPTSIEWQQSFGSSILYYPEGYRLIKHIFVEFEDEDIINDAYKAYVSQDDALYKKAVSEGMDSIKPKLDEIMTRLDSGDDFTEVMNENTQVLYYGALENSKVIGPYTKSDIPEYNENALKLTKGKHSLPFGIYNGAYILYCEKILDGEVPFEDVREATYHSILQLRKQDKWDQLSKEWIDEATSEGTLKMYTERY